VQFTSAKAVCTNVSFNKSSRTHKVCASNGAHPGLSDMSNRGVKLNQPWNSAAHNCRNKLRLCTIVLAITNLEPCRCAPECRATWFVRFEQQLRDYKSLSPGTAQLTLQKQFTQILFDYESSRVHTYGAHLSAGNWKAHNYLYSIFMILP